jgi:hypothetical protein
MAKTPEETRRYRREYMRQVRRERRARLTEQKYDELERTIARMMPVSSLDPKRTFYRVFQF